MTSVFFKFWSFYKNREKLEKIRFLPLKYLLFLSYEGSKSCF